MRRQPSRSIQSLPPNLVRATALILILPVIGTAGYMIIEGWPFLDALYMTVITLTTIGYREVNPLSDAGIVFTMALAITGVGAIFYALISIFQFLLEGELGTLLGVRRMQSQIERINGHYVLCGFGRVGEEIARELASRDIPFVVIETTPSSVERAESHGYLLLVGDATSDEMLKRAGIDRARCLLAASDSDSGNTFITLTAKALNPDIFVVARASRPESQPRMRRAGADRVFSPYTIAGRHMAISALQPVVVEFIDTLATGEVGEAVLAEIEVSEESGFAGQTIGEILQDCKTIVTLGVHKKSGSINVAPALTSLVEVGDRIIVMGEEKELEAVHPADRPLRPSQQAPSHRPRPVG